MDLTSATPLATLKFVLGPIRGSITTNPGLNHDQSGFLRGDLEMCLRHGEMNSLWNNRTRPHLFSYLPLLSFFFAFSDYFPSIPSVAVFVQCLTENGVKSVSYPPVNFLKIGTSLLRNRIFCSVHNIATTCRVKKVVPISTLTTSLWATINLTRYRVFPNRTINQTISPNASGRSFASLSIGATVVTSILFSEPTGRAEQRIRLKTAPVSNEKRFVIVTTVSATSVSSTK